MKQKKINWFGTECTLACDGLCNKAWGVNHRPREYFDPNEPDDMALHADGELGEAPEDPGTYEGGFAKPDPSQVGAGEGMNKWCSRECERSTIAKPGEPIQLRDLTQRLYNQPWKHPK